MISGFRFLFLFLAIVACRDASKSPQQMTKMLPPDPHSSALPAQVRVRHMHLDIKADFSSRTISGLARLTCENNTMATTLVLDIRNLKIEKVFLDKPDVETEFSIDSVPGIPGQALRITVGTEKEQTVWVKYTTTEGSDALQWLDPSQTAGKKHPFLFTQGQAILSRTWFPCQDGPGMRFTWSADVEVPNGLKAIMSAEKREEKAGTNRFHFEMSHPVPAYLVALAVGNLEFKGIDARTGVFAEPEMLDRSVYEFQDMGKMLAAAEALYGPYRWGRYDVLVLPPSFPFGGMENPCVTFATPTILAGDRSLVSLVAHELAHSWSGNLVTNTTWNDFWLNEGFTVYFERRIMEAIEGKPYAEMLAVIGYQDLQATLEDLKEDSASTCLKLHLEGKDPDDGMNDIAYEKGYLLLCHLENLVGREKWDAFLRSYFDNHAFRSMSTEQFLEYLEGQLLKPAGITLTQSQAKLWIYEPFLPQGHAVPVSKRFSFVDAQIKLLDASGRINRSSTADWSSHEWLHFLRGLPSGLTLRQMEGLDAEFGFTKSRNSEILFAWLMLSVEHKYLPAYDALEQFLEHTGRRKFVLPLYKQLLNDAQGKDLAKKLFALSKNNYHSVTRSSVEAVLSGK